MARDIIKENGKAELESFPSARLLVKLYSFGAILALVFTFTLTLDSTQVTLALLTSWILTSGALGLSIFVEAPKENTQSTDDSDDW
ncbi:MAG: hypothetical protein IT291_00595 [Deltaproteobacteria bacterium]|nr:hypothetical protein [Deltaproteobacteria bacterium]